MFEEVKDKLEERYTEQNTCFPNQAHKNCPLERSNFEGLFKKMDETTDSVNFPFEDTNSRSVNDRDAAENRRKIANHDFSPDIGEGWNPLSPYSGEESYNQPSNAEDERLLTR